MKNALPRIMLALSMVLMSLGFIQGVASATNNGPDECYVRNFHEEHRYQRTIEVPAVEEVSHQEYKYSKQVETFKTQYEIDKFTRERTREQVATWQRYSLKGGAKDLFPSWSTPPSPSVAPIIWQANTASDPHGIGEEGAYFVSNGGNGNGDWFYLDQTGWTYGPWSDWSTPERYVPHGTHDAFVDVVPAPNWQDHDGNGNNGTYDRDWALLATGVTQQVSTGFVTENYNDGNWTTDTLGDPWVKVDEKTVIDVEYVPGYSYDEFFPVEGYTTETPEGEGWVLIDTTTVEDESTPFDCPDATATEGDCDNPGVLTLLPEESELFTWEINDEDLTEVTATVVPSNENVVIEATEFGPFDLSQPSDEVCNPPTTTTPPTTTEPPVTTTTPPTTTTVVEVISEKVDVGQPETLAFTGNETLPKVLLGGGVVLAGVAMVLYSRRRQANA